jgi:hypothetical protein
MSRFRKLLGVAAAAAVSGGVGLAADPTPHSTPYTVPLGGAPCPTLPGCPPTPAPLNFGTPTTPGMPYSGQPGQAPGTMPSTPAADPGPSFASTLAGAGVGESAAVGLGGYIDNAVPATMFRLRYDAAYFNNRPDRAEFFYAKCGCFRTLTPPQLDANGPPLPETGVDYQDVASYFEYAYTPRLSFFTEIPVRFLNPEVNRNTAGLADINFGFKYALINCPDRVLTFQLRTITPSGDGFDGLGTTNWWLEPGFLYLRQLSPRWQLFGELRDQIPVSPRSDFTGNVLRYGLGTAFMAYQNQSTYVAPVFETVGWTILSGKESGPGATLDSTGETIVNAKFGVRVGFGEAGCGSRFPTRNDIYIGYGRPLTGAFWYKDVLRLEYRRFF